MGNILKGLKELLSDSKNIVDALTNNQVLSNKKPMFDVSRETIMESDILESSFSNDDNPRTGGIIGKDGDFRQADGTQDYFFETRTKENLICSRSQWAKDSTMPIKYVKALAKNIKSNEINALSDENIVFSLSVNGVAEIYDSQSTILESATSKDGVPSVKVMFRPFSDWKLKIYNSPECLNYFSFKSVLIHENRHIQQIKILRKSFFLELANGDSLEDPKETSMLITRFAGIRLAMEEDAYRIQEEFISGKSSDNPDEKVSIDLAAKRAKATNEELLKLQKALKGKPIDGVYREQLEETRDKWIEIFKKK